MCDKFKKNVPSPWCPVHAVENESGCIAEVWGRTYKIENNLLFSSVTSLGDELLSSPIRIAASENGKKIDWRDTDAFLSEADNEKAVIYATAQSEAFIVNTCTTLEFDGFATVDIKLMPRGFTVPQLFGLEKKETPKTYLDYFHIEIPIKKEFATLYHSYPCGVLPDASGASGDSDANMYSGSGKIADSDMASGFSSVIFLGNDEKGFFTYLDTDEGWQPADINRMIEYDVKDDEVVIRLRIIDGQPKAWEETETPEGQYEYPDLSYRVFFQASPLKPFPKNPFEEKRLHIDCFKKIEPDYIDFLANPVVPGSNETGYDRIKRLGVTTLILHEKWNQVQNYWKLTYRTRHQIKTIIEECHKRGIKVVPYFGYEISTLADIWNDKRDEYRRIGGEQKKGLGWYRFPAQRELCVCYNSPIADEFADGLEKLVDEYGFDGIYLDGTGMVWNCRNTAHGCGYYDSEGNLKSTYPILGVRRLMRRLYEIFESRGKTINCHVSDCICGAGMAFTHGLWLGEYIQYTLVKTGADKMPEGYMRATHSGRNFGIPAEFLVYENKPIWGFDDAFAFTLIHGVLPRPNDIGEPLEKMSKLWKIIDSFDIGESEWCPYFREGSHPFKADNNAVKISAYKYTADDRHKWLIFIANSEAAEIEACVVSGLAGGKLTNAQTGEPVYISGDGITLDFGRFDHYIFIFEN